MDIEVGDYIRTLNGMICKVLSIRQKSRFRTNTGHISTSPERYFVDSLEKCSISKPYVKKHSKNIKDLIEVGDIIEWEAEDIGNYGVNEVIRRPETKKILGVYPEEYDYLLPLERLKIIKILPKEQFEKNSYEVQYG